MSIPTDPSPVRRRPRTGAPGRGAGAATDLQPFSQGATADRAQGRFVTFSTRFRHKPAARPSVGRPIMFQIFLRLGIGSLFISDLYISQYPALSAWCDDALPAIGEPHFSADSEGRQRLVPENSSEPPPESQFAPFTCRAVT